MKLRPLGSPVELVGVERRAGPGWRAGAAALQGWRAAWEDAHFLADGVFGVVDGHGGAGAARGVAEVLPAQILELQAREAHMADAFKACDELLRARADVLRSGACAVVAALLPTSVCIAHAGDSRALVMQTLATEKHEWMWEKT